MNSLILIETIVIIIGFSYIGFLFYKLLEQFKDLSKRLLINNTPILPQDIKKGRIIIKDDETLYEEEMNERKQKKQ